MSFLVLTREAFRDLQARAKWSGALLYVNPGLLTPDEAATLQAEGAQLRVLAKTVDSDAPADLAAAIAEIEKESAEPVWVGHGPKPSPSLPGSPPAIFTDPSRRAALAGRAAGFARSVFRSAGRRMLSEKPLLIVPYLGYGNADRIFLRGRVLLDEGFAAQGPDDSGLRNLIELYKRLESDEVSGAHVRARFADREVDAVTDRGGYFTFEISLSEPLPGGSHAVELELTDSFRVRGRSARATARVLVPASTARFGIISDIDDTILWTNVTNRLNMLLMLGRSNPHTRKPFKGVAAFYRALRDGASGEENNPLFYVSSSPWHLYTPLMEFLRVQDIPAGPLMLKELSLKKLFGSGRHASHKLQAIENIMRFYPHLPFVLIGDSGEKDPEIYAEVVKRHPRAVRAIYIRNVNPDPARIEALDRLIEEVRASGAQLILAPDSESAAAHAAAEGLIRPAEMRQVRSEKEQEDSSSA